MSPDSRSFPSTPAEVAPVPPTEQPKPSTDQPKAAEVPDWEYKNQKSVVLYEALTARVGHRDALLWQPPVLAMTAQAFLLTIALGHESGPIARFIAAGLGLWVTYLSVQLMLKHNLHMWNDMVSMVALERRMKLPTSAIDHETKLGYVRAKHPELVERLREKKGVTRFASVHVWIWGLAFFAFVNLFLLIFAGLDMFGVPCADWLGGDSKCVLRL